VLTRLFDVGHVPESVLREVQLPPAVDWVAERLADGSFALFTETPDIETRARELMALSRYRPLKAIDTRRLCVWPQDLGMGIRCSRKTVAPSSRRTCLTTACLWRAFEVLVEAWRRGLVQEIVEELRRYEQDGLHLFRRRDWEYIWSLVGRR
jgi:hypothetical protein